MTSLDCIHCTAPSCLGGDMGEDNSCSAPSTVRMETKPADVYGSDSHSQNPCKLCTPLGACLAFKGVWGCIPFLHGSQGCSTYIRRYLISHFREPVDIASSNFHEETAIFGGAENLYKGIQNVIQQYAPEIIGIATTCLAETIGEDMASLMDHCRKTMNPCNAVPLVTVSTASYRGCHIDGFHAAVAALVESFAKPSNPGKCINLLPNMVSPSDLRHLKEIGAEFNLPMVILPDYSETLDGETWDQYQRISPGGTHVADIIAMGTAQATIEFGRSLQDFRSAGQILRHKCEVPHKIVGLPVGVHETDRFIKVLEEVSGRRMSRRLLQERGRLVDAYIDGHKYVMGKRAIVYGEEDWVIGLTSFLSEIGAQPVLCAISDEGRSFKNRLYHTIPELNREIRIITRCDFAQISQMADEISADFLLGNSKGYPIARKLGIPLVRVGFPIHDRIGGSRILHVGYRGAMELYDRIINALLSYQQEKSPIGYSYL